LVAVPPPRSHAQGLPAAARLHAPSPLPWHRSGRVRPSEPKRQGVRRRSWRAATHERETERNCSNTCRAGRMTCPVYSRACTTGSKTASSDDDSSMSCCLAARRSLAAASDRPHTPRLDVLVAVVPGGGRRFLARPVAARRQAMARSSNNLSSMISMTMTGHRPANRRGSRLRKCRYCR
jgi:hypothetical protein